MREIKFRQAIYLNIQFLKFHYWGFLKDIHGNYSFIGPMTNTCPSQKQSLEVALKDSDAFTGLHDRNVKEIFEGDIIEVDTLVEAKKGEKTALISNGVRKTKIKSHEVVVWEKYWGWTTKANRHDGHSFWCSGNSIEREWEVIGNIYQDKHLLEEK